MLEKVIEVIKNTYRRPDIILTADTNLLDDLNLNSLEIAELMCAFEDEFEIEIPDRVLAGFQLVKDIVEYIEKQV
ncbi:MAG: DUF1493 family protein [Oscillospiraceae bacterium]|nr:DUF1493 family protein [Oscillospiraceae bacterium]